MKLWKVKVDASIDKGDIVNLIRSLCRDGVILYLVLLTEEMISGLQQLGWKKVDVSFHSAMWPFFAHNNIHVMILTIQCLLFEMLLGFEY